MKPTLQKFHQRLSGIRPGLVLASGLAMIGLVTWVDFAARETFDLSHFYLVPLYPITWFVGLAAGIFSSALIALAWGAVEFRIDADFVEGSKVVWNSLADFGLYTLFCLILSWLKGLMHRLQTASDSDPLTGVANRRSFYRAAESEIRRNRRYGDVFSVVYFDVDNFKAVNDALGHSTGDELLCRVASVLRSHSRDIDVVARLGGDEFAVLLPETGQDGVRSYIAKLQLLLDGLAADNAWPITFSIGVVTCVAAPESVEMLIERADTLMYAVKKSGKNSVSFSTWSSTS